MALLRGWTPVFPQTFGWDSTALLTYAGEERCNGAAFKWLLSKGFIRVCLLDHDSILDAALAAFQNPSRSLLGAWPGFDTPEKRKPLIQAIKTNKEPADLPDHVRNRLQSLRELSAAVGEAPKASRERRRGDSLRRTIEKAYIAALQRDPTVASVLQQCIRLHDPNNRTVIYTFLNEQEAAGGNIPPEVRDIVDGCFNAVAAWCVGARPALTALRSRCSSSVAVDILSKALPSSVRSGVFEAPVEKLKSKNVSKLELVNWSKIRYFLREYEGLRMSEKERQAVVAKLLSEIELEESRRYALLIQHANSVANFLIWGGAGYIGAKVTGATTGQATVAGIVSGLAGAAGPLNFGSGVSKPLQRRLEKKYNGLIQSPADLEQDE